jgi:hypothetical protein
MFFYTDRFNSFCIVFLTSRIISYRANLRNISVEESKKSLKIFPDYNAKICAVSVAGNPYKSAVIHTSQI